MALGIKTGDEVIMPALTFVSDANVVRQLGAQPIFADSISISINVCENDILEKLTKRTEPLLLYTLQVSYGALKFTLHL